jgi:cytochrome c2
MLIVIVAAISLSFTLPPAGAQTSVYLGNPLSGSRIFFQKGCANCHSILDVGGNIGPDLGKVELNYSFFGIASIMWNHAPKMLNKFVAMDISFPRLSSEEMDALITFLSYLNYLERPSDPERGGELFREKKCVRCHSVGGTGGSVGPKLDKFRPYQSPIFITAAFWNKAPEMAKTMLSMGIERPEFKGNEIMDIMAYIREEAIGADAEYKRVYVPPGDPRAGKTLVKEKKCLHCHSIHGEGGEIGPDLGKPGLRISFTEIAGRMWNHGPKMWLAMSEENIDIPKFSETEMSDVLSYIYFAAIQEKGGNPLNGELLIKEKGCNTCHPVAGKGGDPDLAPDFAERSSELGLDTPTKVITEMWNHIQSMSKRVEEMGMTWPTINSHDMADITSYIVRLAKP